MKKVVFVFLLLVSCAVSTQAQKYCIIDSKYILERMNEYKNAQISLDHMSKQWQTEIDGKMQEVDK